MARIWVVVADSSRARFFEAESRVGGIREFDEMDHAPARAKVCELVTDGNGSGSGRNGAGRHRMQQEVAPKEHEARHFARELSLRLDRERRRGAYERLVLAAAPRFLGMLRPCLSGRVRETISKELCKDLVNVGARKVRERLPERL